MAASEEVVKVKLVLDTDAAKATEEYKSAMAEIAKEEIAKANTVADAKAKIEAKKTTFDKIKGFDVAPLEAGIASAALKVGGILAAIHTAAYGAATAFVTTASHVAFSRLETVKQLTMGIVSLSGQKNVSIETARNLATVYEREFRKIGVAAGASASEVNRAYMAIASGITNRRIHRMTGEDAERITKDMAKVSSVIPGGLGALTDSYEKLKDGTVDSRDSMVQLITTTGVLGGTAEQVARKLAFMMPEKRMALAEEAMKRMAKTTGGIGGFAGFGNALAGIGSSIMGDIGEPLVNKLLPMMNNVVSYFEKNGETIARVSERIGQSLGNFASMSGGILKEIYDKFTMDTDGMGSAIEQAADYFKDSFQWVYDNRDSIASSMKVVFELMLDVAKVFRLLFDSVDDMTREEGSMTNEQKRQYQSALEMAKTGDFAGAQKRFDASQAEALELGTAIPEELLNYSAQFADDMKLIKNSFADLDMAAATGDVDAYIKAFNTAASMHDKGMMEYAGKLLSGNQELQHQLINAGEQFKGGIAGFVEAIGRGVLPADFMKMVNAQTRGAALGDKLSNPINFNGNTFNIRQDFRDQDPERVMLTFKADIMKSAAARTSAGRSSTPVAGAHGF